MSHPLDVEPNISVSIVLLSLMRWEQTRQCIQSLINHTAGAFEVVVVDMGSEQEIVDGLRQISTAHPRVKLIFQSQNLGVSAGRNLGAKAASGHYLVFLDNDCEVTAGWLAPLIKSLELSARVAAVGCMVVSPRGKLLCAPAFVKAEFTEGTLASIGMEFLRDIPADDPAVISPQEVTWYPTTCLAVRKSAFFEVGGFDESLLRCEEDKDLCLSLRKSDYQIRYTPESTVVHHNSRPSPQYTRIRNDIKQILRDIAHFEGKWHCRPFIRHARILLRQAGVSDDAVDKVKRFSFVNHIVEDKLELRELILTVTNVCNHRCSMCYYHASLNQKTSHLTRDEYQRTAAGIGTLKILWVSGGEPFLRRDLVDVCGVFYDHNPLQHVFIPTNGSQPHQIAATVGALLDRLPGVRVTVMFSLEGLEQSHDQTHGVKGAFASVKASIERLHFVRARQVREGRSFGILLNTVVSNRNLQEVPPLMAYVKEHIRVDSHFLSPLRGMPKDEGLSAPQPSQFAKLLQDAQPYFDYYTDRSTYDLQERLAINAQRERRHGVWLDVLAGGQLPNLCQAGRYIGVLEPDGGVRLCEDFPVIGNLRDHGYDFGRLWFSHQADSSRRHVPGCKCTHACFIGASEPRSGKVVAKSLIAEQ